MAQKIIIYQMLPRLFGNTNTNCIEGGTIEQNGCGKFNDITTEALRCIRSLGATHVWYTGILEHTTRTDYTKYGIENTHPATVKGEAGSPYAIKDYYDVDPDLAVNIEKRREEFRSLVERTHKEGMKVIIDFIPNHVARHYKSDNRPEGTFDFGQNDDKSCFFLGHNNFYYLGEHSYGCNIDAKDCADEEYSENPLRATGNDCFGSPSRNDWYDTVKLNYGIDYRTGKRQFSPVPDTWVKMLKILRYWASQGIDGFRCDMVEMTPVEFWYWAVGKIKEEFPHLIFIGEIYQPHIYRSFIYEGHFDYLYDKVGLYDTLRAVMCGCASANNITYALQATSDIRQHMLTFLENHDEQRIASDFFATNAKRALSALILSATVDSQPFMLYAGEEFGEKGMDKEGYSGVDGRTSIFDWCSAPSVVRMLKGKLLDSEKELLEYYQKLFTFAMGNKAITCGETFDLQYANYHNDLFDTNKCFVFARKYSYDNSAENFHRGGNGLLSEIPDKKDKLVIVAADFSQSYSTAKVNLPEDMFRFWNIPFGQLNPFEQVEIKFDKYGVGILEFSL